MASVLLAKEKSDYDIASVMISQISCRCEVGDDEIDRLKRFRREVSGRKTADEIPMSCGTVDPRHHGIDTLKKV